MTENKTQNSDVTVLSIQQILSIVLRGWWMILLSAIFCGAACYYVSANFITPKYQSSVAFYVNNNSFSTDNRLSYSDLWVSQSLVDTYMVILDTGDTMRAVIAEADVDVSVEELQKMIRAKIVEETEIFSVTVTGLDPEDTKKLADAIGTVLPSRINSIMDGTSAKIVDYAVLPVSPSEPAAVRNAVSGAIFGFICCASILILRALLTFRIRKETDISRVTDLPILASVPAMDMTRRDALRKSEREIAAGRVGAAMTDRAAEGMHLLCLKLPFCFTEAHDAHVIGVSSAMAGEGKSTSAVNLAYSLAKLEKRVLLMDCDLRRPTVNSKLSLRRTPGMTEYLVRHASREEIVKNCVIGDVGFDVIPSGRIPPNPIELLNSDGMAQLLQALRQSYDYVILDLPPVGEVGDAIVTAKLTDGNLLVVRQAHCTRSALRATIHELRSVEARILGVVYNCVK